jgi:hypothetical protein
MTEIEALREVERAARALFTRWPELRSPLECEMPLRSDLERLRAALALPREEGPQFEVPHYHSDDDVNLDRTCYGPCRPIAPPPPTPTERSEDDRLLEEAIDSTCPGLDEAYRLNQELARLDRASEGKGGKP